MDKFVTRYSWARGCWCVGHVLTEKPLKIEIIFNAETKDEALEVAWILSHGTVCSGCEVLGTACGKCRWCLGVM